MGIESVTPEGLKSVYKDFNLSGDELVARLQVFKKHGVHVLGSFIFGLPSDKPETFVATAELAQRAGVSVAQFVMLTPFPGTVDFAKWEKEGTDIGEVDGVPLDAVLADPAVAPAQGLLAAPAHVGRRDPRQHAEDVGSVLRAAAHLGTFRRA